MFTTILKLKKSTKVCVRIIDTFVKMMHYVNYNKNVLLWIILLIDDKVDKNTKRIDRLFEKFSS